MIKIFKIVSDIKIHEKGYKFVNDRKGHDFRYSIENNKMKKLIKIKFSNFDQNLKKTIDHYIKYFSHYNPSLKEKWLKKKLIYNK